MEVQFTPDQQAKLSRMAATQGRAAEALVQKAVDVRRMIETRYPG